MHVWRVMLLGFFVPLPTMQGSRGGANDQQEEEKKKEKEGEREENRARDRCSSSRSPGECGLVCVATVLLSSITRIRGDC